MASIAIIGQEGSGRSSLASKLGKKGNVTDITMYDFAKAEQILTFIDSSGYPASPKPLMSALAMSEIVLLCIPPKGIKAATGECIIAVDLMELERGIIVQTMSDTSNPYEIEETAQTIRSLIQGTPVQNWDIIPVSTTTFDGMEQLKDAINGIDREITAQNRKKAELPSRVVVDHSFNVKGIGSVVLGRVIQGTIRKHDTYIIHPLAKEIEIRNIQMHDMDKTSAGPGSRVGLALKGVQAKEVKRGHIISSSETSSSDIELTCRVSTFSSGFCIGSTLHLYVNLQSAPVKVSNITINGQRIHEAPAGSVCEMACSATEVLCFGDEDVFVLADLNKSKQRFVAGGHIIS
jgi:selenocysteine-specific elongation factor